MQETAFKQKVKLIKKKNEQFKRNKREKSGSHLLELTEILPTEGSFSFLELERKCCHCLKSSNAL